MLDAYSANKFNADKLYKFADNGGQLLRVTGTVVSIEHEYVELSGGDWILKNPFSNRVHGAIASVYCYYDDTSIRQHINAGDYVTLIGEWGGETDFSANSKCGAAVSQEAAKGAEACQGQS